MAKTKKSYCRPFNAGLNSETPAVARTIAKALTAMLLVDNMLVEGQIVEDMRATYHKIVDGLEAEGWTVSCMNGNLEGTDRYNVYPPGSPAGARIRKYRETDEE